MRSDSGFTVTEAIVALLVLLALAGLVLWLLRSL